MLRIIPFVGQFGSGVRIPARLLKEAKGVAILTLVKGGFGLAGVEFGTGLVVARLGERWSARSAIEPAGLSWGSTLLYFWEILF
jgi:lipid-binding SYLF domain-containing protein